MRDGDLVADLEPMPVRFYPNNGGSPDTTLASQLLGFVTDDGPGQVRHRAIRSRICSPVQTLPRPI